MQIQDALILTLKLDSSQFQKGAKDVESSVKKTKETVAKHGKDIEGGMNAATLGVTKLAAAFLGLFSVLTGGKAVKDFISDTTKSDAAIGRFSANIGMSAKQVQGWEGAIKSVGGSAGDAMSSMRSLEDSMQSLASFGDSSLLPVLARIQSMGGKRINLGGSMSNMLDDLNVDLHNIYQKSPELEGMLSRKLGISDSLNNVLIQAPENVRKLRKEMEQYAATAADIDSAAKRQNAWTLLQAAGESLGRSILTTVTPALLAMNKAIRDFIDTHGEAFKAWFKDVAEQIKSAPWAKWWEDIKAGAKSIDAVAQAMGGWKVVLETLVAIQVLNWLSPIVTAFGLLAGSILSIVGAGPAFLALLAGGAAYGLWKYGGSESPGYPGNPIAPGANPATPNYYPHGPSVHQREGGAPGAAPAENGTPWNHQTGGPPVSSTVADKSLPQEARALLNSIAAGESKGDYGVTYGGGHPDLSNGPIAGTASGRYQFRKTTWDDLHKAHPELPTDFSPESQDKAAWQLAQDRYKGDLLGDLRKGTANLEALRPTWGGIKPQAYGRELERERGGQSQEGPLSGSATPHPARYQGKMRIGDETFDYASGSTRMGRGSSPFGSHPITGFDPTALHGRGGGAFRTRDVYDPQTGDKRGAVEIHMSNQDDVNRVETHGCFGIPRSQWPRAKAASQKYIRENPGGATLMVSPNGEASVIPRGGLRYGPHSVASKPAFSPRPQSFIPPIGAGTMAMANATHHHGHVNSNNSSNEVHVGNVNVHTAATDASGIVRDIKPAIERTSFAMFGNYSLA